MVESTNEKTGPAVETVAALVGGLLIGIVVVGLFALLGSTRQRRRHASEAEHIRRDLLGLADEARAAAEAALPQPKPAQPAYPDERLGNLLRGLVLGALAGGAMGVVRARQSGDATRARVRETLRDLTHEARGAVTDFTAWAADERPSPPATEPTADALTLAPTPR